MLNQMRIKHKYMFKILLILNNIEANLLVLNASREVKKYSTRYLSKHKNSFVLLTFETLSLSTIPPDYLRLITFVQCLRGQMDRFLRVFLIY